MTTDELKTLPEGSVVVLTRVVEYSDGTNKTQTYAAVRTYILNSKYPELDEKGWEITRIGWMSDQYWDGLLLNLQAKTKTVYNPEETA